MKQTVTRNDFVDAFRSIRPDNFSHSALRALFDYFEQYEDDTGEEMELDVIGICCEWAEYGSALEGAKEHGFKSEEASNEEAALEWLRERTPVVEFEGGVVFPSF